MTRHRYQVRRPRLQPSLALLLATILLPACTGSDSEPSADAVRERRAGDEPLLVLGSAVGNPEQEFSRVVDAELVGDSAVLVVSAGTNDMRLFGIDGSLLQSYGRQGEGPGENQGIVDVSLHGDTLWTFDTLLKRLDKWSLRDGYVQSSNLRLESGQPIWMVVGVFSDGAVLGGSSPRPKSSKGGTTDEHLDLAHWRPGTVEPVPLDSIYWNQTFLVLQENGSTGFRHPFSAGASLAVAGSAYWYTDGRTPALQHHSASGELLRTVQLPFAPAAITAADREEFAAKWLGESQGQARQRLQAVVDGAVYPETLPAITDLVVADDGAVWAGQYVRSEESERSWFVVAADGTFRERVALPADLTLHDVQEERVAGVRRDDNGVEHVVVLQLRPGPAAN